MDPVDVEETYLLIDGENIDATLGLSVLERRPTPEERPVGIVFARRLNSSGTSMCVACSS